MIDPILIPLLAWLNHHPWGWLLILSLAVACFSVGLAAPISWRNAEGSIVDDGVRFARVAHGGSNPLRWVFGAGRLLHFRRGKGRSGR